MKNRPSLACLLLAVLSTGCEPPPQNDTFVALAGAGVAGSDAPANATWQSTVTRRIRWGPGIDVMAKPFPDGERMAVTDWTTGDVAVYRVATGELERLTHQPTPYAEGIAMFTVPSPDGSRIAYAWQDYREDMEETQLRVIGLDDSAPERLYRGPAVAWINAWDWSQDGSRLLVLRMHDDGVFEIATVATSDGSATTVKTLGHRDPTELRFSPDGRFIAYDYPTTEESDERDIYILSSDGRNETALVEGPANDRLLGWAPDGQSVLFLSDRAGTPGAWLVPVSGGRAVGEPYLVKPDMWNTEPIGFDAEGHYFYGVGVGARALYEVTFSADGRSLLGEPRDLTSRSHQEVQYPRWSPDGRYAAFSIMRQGRPAALLVRSLESGEEREVRVDRRLSYFLDLEWLPDGQSVVALVKEEQQVDSRLVRIDARTGETEILLQPGPRGQIDGVTVGPDGRTLYYPYREFAETPASSVQRILAYDMETGAERTLHDGDPTRRIRSLVISPDGRDLAFLEGNPAGDPRILVMPAAGGTARVVADVWSTSVAWAPDSRALLLQRLTSDRAVNPPARLQRVDVATGEVTDLGLEMGSLGVRGRFTFHPDGRRALFTAGAPEMEWWVMEGFLGEGGAR